MNNITTLQNNLEIDEYRDSYLCFSLENNKYAINIQDVVEVMKLPELEHLHNYYDYVSGILNYNGFSVNIVDLRFCLGLELKPYLTSNHLIITKTDEMVIGLIIDNPEDVVSLDKESADNIAHPSQNSIIDTIYTKSTGSISVLDLDKIEDLIKKDSTDEKLKVPDLFPKDEKSKKIFAKRKQILQLKENAKVSKNLFAQDEYVNFSVNGNTYCINIDYISEFIKNVPITRIPCDFDYIEGVISLRGNFVTVINLGSFIHEKITVDKEQNNIIVINFADYKIGFAVDKIFEIENIPENAIKVEKEDNNGYIFGEVVIGDKISYIIDIKNLMADNRLFIEQN